MKLIEILKEDCKVFLLQKNTPNFTVLLSMIFKSFKFRAVVYMRLASFFVGKNRFLVMFFYNKNLKRGIDIHPSSQIGQGIRIAHPLAIVIGKDCIVGKYVRLQQSVTLGGNSGKESKTNKSKTMPFIDDFVLIGPGACILGPITIGKYAVIGANSVLSKNVDEFSIVAGNPAIKISEVTPDNIYKFHYKVMV